MKADWVLASTLGALGAAQAMPASTCFRLDAPQAREVFLAGEMTDWDTGRLPMQRGADGAWQRCLPLAAGQWVYKFVVDGQWMADPTAEGDDDGRGGRHSYVFVGEGEWTVPAGAPRGRLEEHRVPSRAWGQPQRVQVYLPPGWQRGQALPVLWLLHGRGMSPDQWSRTGRIADYLDGLQARGEIGPMVVVMPSSGEVFYTDVSQQHIAEELPPWLLAHYGLGPGRAQTALAGMSMGGSGALQLLIDRPQQYGFAYSLSGAFRGVLAQVRTLKALPAPLVLRTGREDHVTPSNRELFRLLSQRGITVDYLEQAGGHSWHYWSGQIGDMLRAVNRRVTAAP